jgi:S-(hydroxymethyl)glutathione dehydrogenase/alcohol dehydrogenase
VKTRAALFRTAGAPLEVREIDLEEPRGDDVLVRMVAVGICGSDLHIVRGEWQRPTPMVLGHEGSGVVEAVGPDVRHVAPGDHVVLSWAPGCGTCGPCRRGRPAACLRLRAAMAAGTLPDGTTRLALDGEPVFRMTATGAMADLVLVPAAAALPCPAGLAFEQAALLGCAALTGIGAVLNAARQPADATAVVIGAGGVGQFAIQGARLARASHVIAVDPIAARGELALALGATTACPPDDVEAVVAEIAAEGADFAYDAVGSSATAQLALRLVRPGGVAVLIGMPPAGTRLDLDPADFTQREKTLLGTIYGSDDPALALPRLLDEVERGAIALEPLVGPAFSLERAQDAIDASLAGEPRRVLVSLE